jgi:hypothetical protein
MEAVWKIEVRDFPAFIIVDDKGNDFFAGVTGPKQPLLTIGPGPGGPGSGGPASGSSGPGSSGPAEEVR